MRLERKPPRNFLATLFERLPERGRGIGTRAPGRQRAKPAIQLPPVDDRTLIGNSIQKAAGHELLVP
jgi:hypothetical protein